MGFPRIRDKDFRLVKYEALPDRFNGRLDLYMSERFGVPGIYKIVAAANNISNAMALRATIRPYEESVRNELILKGYSGNTLERMYREAIDKITVGERDWHTYGNNVDGVITEADAQMPIFFPDNVSGGQWYERYNRVMEDD